jgi:hypothetical protein
VIYEVIKCLFSIITKLFTIGFTAFGVPFRGLKPAVEAGGLGEILLRITM